MRRTRLLRTSTFRFALVYLGLFSVSALALLGFVYWTTAGIATVQADETVEAEITGLGEQYRRTGVPGLVAVVRERSANQRDSLYLLTDPGGLALAGNISSWPQVDEEQGGWLEFDYEKPTGAATETHRARAKHLRLAGGFNLLVGRDVQERRDIERLIQVSLAWSLALILGLGLVGGVVMSRNLLRRIETINRTSRDIIDGALDKRIPVAGDDSEFDELSGNLNAMLDQIERLVIGMRQVTTNIAHDLRSPLNRLRNRLEVALLEHPSEKEYREVLERTVAEAEAMLETFNALLKIAQAETGQLAEETQSLDAGALLGDAVDLYEPVAADKSIDLVLDAEEGAVFEGHAQLVAQAVANLIDNAIKYTPAGGTVRVRGRRGDGFVEITVADSGPGIPSADRGRVLDRFVRLDASRNAPGSGLGLSLVRAVAQLHHARLALEDNRPGLRVVLEFPAGRDAA